MVPCWSTPLSPMQGRFPQFHFRVCARAVPASLCVPISWMISLSQRVVSCETQDICMQRHDPLQTNSREKLTNQILFSSENPQNVPEPGSLNIEESSYEHQHLQDANTDQQDPAPQELQLQLKSGECGAYYKLSSLKLKDSSDKKSQVSSRC